MLVSLSSKVSSFFSCVLVVFKETLVWLSNEGFSTNDLIMINILFFTYARAKVLGSLIPYCCRYFFTILFIGSIKLSITYSTWLPPSAVKIELTKLNC